MLFRLARGSGLTGLAGMAHASPLPAGGDAAIFLVRPLLRIPKARLVATLKAAGIALQRGSDESRSALCARAVAHVDAASRARGARCARPGAAGGADAARGSDHRIRGRRGARGLGARSVARARSDRLRGGAVRRPAGRGGACGSSAAPLRMPGTRDRSNSASSKRFTRRCGKARAPLRRTLAGALITLRDGRLIVERAPRAPQVSRTRRTGNSRFTK